MLILAKPALASIDLTISDLATKDDYYQLTAKVTGMSSSSATYIQAMLYPEGVNKYFGFTFSRDGQWIKYDGSPDKQYVIDNFVRLENDQPTTIFLKPDFEDSDYQGPGKYLVKLKRFTASGSSSDYSNTLELNLSQTTPTPTPTPTSTPTTTPTKTATSAPTSSKTPTQAPTPTPTPTQSKTITSAKLEPTKYFQDEQISPQVLATSTSEIILNLEPSIASTPPSELATPSTTPISDKNTFLVGAIIFVCSGIALYFRLKTF